MLGPGSVSDLAEFKVRATCAVGGNPEHSQESHLDGLPTKTAMCAFKSVAAPPPRTAMHQHLAVRAAPPPHRICMRILMLSMRTHHHRYGMVPLSIWITGKDIGHLWVENEDRQPVRMNVPPWTAMLIPPGCWHAGGAGPQGFRLFW